MQNGRSEMLKVAEEGFARQAAVLGFSGESYHWDESCWAYNQANKTRTPNIVLDLSCAHLPCFAPWVTAKRSGLGPRDTVIKAMPPAAREKIMHHWHPLHLSLYMNTKTWLSNFPLVSLGDRTEMAHSIEAPPPFLDRNLVEYVNRLPPSLKLRYTPDLDSDTDQDQRLIEKWILREAGRPFVSDEVYRRAKQPDLAPVKWPQDGPLHQKSCTKEAVENFGFISWNSVEQALQKAFGPMRTRDCSGCLLGLRDGSLSADGLVSRRPRRQNRQMLGRMTLSMSLRLDVPLGRLIYKKCISVRSYLIVGGNRPFSF